MKKSLLSSVLVRCRLGGAGWFVLLLSSCEGNVGPWSPPPASTNQAEPGMEAGVSQPGELSSPELQDAGERCGNGKREPGEECDDGNDRSNDGCADCRREAVCGDGVIEGNEECDSEAANCVRCQIVSPSECGNSKVEEGEECDDGNDNSNDGCTACRIGWCGDGIVNSGEACDDGNSVDIDGCDTNCQKRACGDGMVADGEECDPPGDTCSESCKLVPSSCGDGTLQPGKGEQCDDGNDEPGDGCFQCKRECGDGRVDRSIGETCEPRVAYLTCQSLNKAFCLTCAPGMACDSRDACDPDTCTYRAACGDGILQPEYGERCEPPGSRSCDHACGLVPASCGNHVVEGNEQCDPPDGIYCGAQCQHLQCGNGIVEGMEECDPPNDDSCDDECRAIAACEATTPPDLPAGSSNRLPGGGTFDDTVDGWVAQTSVTATHAADIGSAAPGALRIQSTGSVSSGTGFDIRGVATCVRLAPNEQFTFAGAYRFAQGTPTSAGATVSLHLYASPNCSGAVIPNRGAKIVVTSSWASYRQSVDTSSIGETTEASVYVRLDVWRPTTVSSVEMFWDDLQLSSLDDVDSTPQPDQGYCGDCSVQGLEECDDGNRQGGDGCSGRCFTEGCGNGIVDLGEQCDDGNQSYDDDCGGDCRAPDACRQCIFSNCSAKALDVGKGCFGLQGTAQSGKGKGVPLSRLCSELFACVQRTGCALDTAASENSLGGGDLQGMENCYCGNTGGRCLDRGVANGSCRNEVERALESKDPAEIIWRMSGGDPKYPVFGAANEMFTCAVPLPPPAGPGGVCTDVCTSVPQCGNGLREDRLRSFLTNFSPGLFEGTRNGTLTCDDLTAGVSCFPESTCGCFFEECDDNNTEDGDGCDANCFIETCGNGVLQAGEACDDGNRVDGDGCSATCASEWECGNGVAEGQEKCDDGNTANLDGCDSRCELEVCGNGVVQPQLGEQCDPDVSGLCEGCKLVQQDLCTECILAVDIWRVLSDPLKSVNSECVGVGVLDRSSYANGEGVSVPPHFLPNGIRCLANPDCAAAWQCLVDSRCLLSQGDHECYCGADTSIAECATQPPQSAVGVCKDALVGAFASQWGRAPTLNQEFFELWQRWEGSNGTPLTAAASLGIQCLRDPYSLDFALCDVGASHERRVACQNSCFGSNGLKADDVAANTCP